MTWDGHSFGYTQGEGVMNQDPGSQMFERYVDRCLLEAAEARAEAAEQQLAEAQQLIAELERTQKGGERWTCGGTR